MKRSSPFFGLKYLVQCRDFRPFYETIAAFNYDGAAHGYAKDCAKTNTLNFYRVMERDSRGRLTELLDFKPVKTVKR
jgi:hypothetical protein